MSKIVYTGVLGASVTFANFYDVDSLDIASNTSSKATYTDQLSGYKIVLKGSGLVIDGDEVLAGSVKKVTFYNDDGDVLIRITDGNYKADRLDAALQADGFTGLMKKLFAGDDHIVGSKLADDLWGGAGDNTISGGRGRDYISGGLGDDRLSGGAGSDVFLFGKGNGADVVTDFDASGGAGKQDFIAPLSDDYEIHGSDANTIIDFGDGDTLTLLGVKRWQITQADFMELA